MTLSLHSVAPTVGNETQQPQALPRPAASKPHAAPAPPASATASEPGCDVAIGDWSDLLDAVKARLRATGGEWFGTAADQPADRNTERSRVDVLDCVNALDQLQTTLQHELDRHERVEHEIADLRAALTCAHRELLDTRVGERHARHVALHDSLTSLPNRSFFRERLAHTLSRGEPAGAGLAVLYFDLDEFKPINDTHGHDTGDALLKVVASRLKRAVRGGDIVSRMGGDEFACLLDRPPDRDQLSHLACKLLDAVGAPARIGALLLSVRPSIGIAVCPGDGSNADSLLKNADAAMYRAKRTQTGYAFFDDKLDEWPSTSS
jgi:diguanylate cyclase